VSVSVFKQFSQSEREVGDEMLTVLGGAECGGAQAGRAGHAGGRSDSQLGISEQTYYRGKKQYADLESSQVRVLKQLQDANARLKQLVANLSLDKAILQDIAIKKWPRPR
jgi:putative transposase